MTAAALAALACLLASCGGGQPEVGGGNDDAPAARRVMWPAADGAATPVRQGCDLLAGPARTGAALVVAVADAVDPGHAPVPHNPGERLVFAQLYETLVRVDCAGDVQPGLATHWSCTEDSTVWIFAIRPDARFWDGTPVTAGDVRASWRYRCAALDGGVQADPFAWLNAGDQSVEALDARRLKVQLPEPQADLPRLLAHPATAIAAVRDGWTWPVGSGPARLRASTPAPLPELACLPNAHHPDRPAWSALVFQVRPGADPRDLAGTGFDLALVRTLDAVRFYGELPDYRADALPWDRIYLLFSPPSLAAGERGRWTGAAARLDAARDVTTVAARPWPGLVLPAGRHGSCPQLGGPVSFDPPLRRDSDLANASLDMGTVVYPDDDPGAGELARRLAALAGDGARAMALQPTSVQLALRWEMAGALVIPMDVQFPAGCLQMAALLAKASWLQHAALDEGPLPAGDSLVAAHRADRAPADPGEALMAAGLAVPLAASRPWLISRGALAGLAYDFDGTPRLAGVGTARTQDEAP